MAQVPKPIDKAIAALIPTERGAFHHFLSHYVISPLIRMLELHNEHSWDYATSTGTLSWNLNSQGNLFVNHTTGAAIAITANSAVVLAALRPGRHYTLIIYNGSGGGLTPSFSGAFFPVAAVIASGAVGAYEFVVKHPSLTTPAATLIQT